MSKKSKFHMTLRLTHRTVTNLLIQSFIAILYLNFVFCNDRNIPRQSHKEMDSITTQNERNDMGINYAFIGNKWGLEDKMKYYFSKYKNDSCKNEQYTDSLLSDEFEGVKEIGNINHDNIKDSVFVLPPINICERGQAYYFSDTSLPRLLTESNCCHPQNIFLVGDINEDGISEMGQYFSSCTSRYKSIYVYLLIFGEWKEIGHCIFDLNYSSVRKETLSCQ